MTKDSKIIFGIVGAMVAIIAINIINISINKPAINIDSPASNTTVNGKNVHFKGSINPESATLKIEGKQVSTPNGEFNVNVELPDSINEIKFAIYDNTGILLNKEFFIYRKMSPQEKAVLVEKQRIERQERERIDAEEWALKEKELAAYHKTRAGRINKKHSSWSREDCQRIANGDVWIGMHIDMLKVVYGGNPDSANPSNYGNGTQWQWCWSDWNPSCFYDDDNDGLIDSYN